MPSTKSTKEVSASLAEAPTTKIHGSTDGGTTYVPVAVDSDGNLQADILLSGGFNVPVYDYVALTYVSAGNGAGEIETVVYKTGGVGGSVVATLTIAYNASNEISSVTKS